MHVIKAGQLQSKRCFWAILCILCVSLVLISHLFFQEFLFMPPCEKCVYIRLAFLLIAFGGAIALINPCLKILRIFSFSVVCISSIYGLWHSIELIKIHSAINNGKIFGLSPCSMKPNFPFNLQLDTLFPTLFMPKGSCGFDNPVIPQNAILNPVQEVFTNLYSKGFYLIPPLKLGNMAQCSMLVFIIILIAMLITANFTKTKT